MNYGLSTPKAPLSSAVLLPSEDVSLALTQDTIGPTVITVNPECQNSRLNGMTSEDPSPLPAHVANPNSTQMPLFPPLLADPIFFLGGC